MSVAQDLFKWLEATDRVFHHEAAHVAAALAAGYKPTQVDLFSDYHFQVAAAMHHEQLEAEYYYTWPDADITPESLATCAAEAERLAVLLLAGEAAEIALLETDPDVARRGALNDRAQAFAYLDRFLKADVLPAFARAEAAARAFVERPGIAAFIRDLAFDFRLWLEAERPQRIKEQELADLVRAAGGESISGQGVAANG